MVAFCSIVFGFPTDADFSIMIESTESDDLCLTVAVGAPSILRDWIGVEPLLLVEANPERLEQVNCIFKDQQRDYSLHQDVLAEEEGAPVDWLSFNDRRFDGPLDLDSWCEKYPNLHVGHREQRVGRRLADLVETWLSERAEVASLRLRLEIRQGDPLAALMGLGSWLHSLQSVYLDMPIAGEYWFLKVDSWLQERAFRPVKGLAHAWQRDPVETLRLAMENQKMMLANLQDSLDQAVYERDYHMQRASTAESMLDQLNHEVQIMLELITVAQQPQPPNQTLHGGELG
jgi:hypothetical protein